MQVRRIVWPDARNDRTGYVVRIGRALNALCLFAAAVLLVGAATVSVREITLKPWQKAPLANPYSKFATPAPDNGWEEAAGLLLVALCIAALGRATRYVLADE